MNYLFSLLTISAVCFSLHPSQAQNNALLPQISPKSPNAAAFEKYGEIPASLSTGTAQISIPLYTIKVGSLEIPVVLYYCSNGMRTDEIPSYVGMGWSIRAGGVINYEQRGLPDFSVASPGMFNVGIGMDPIDSLKKFLLHKMTHTNAHQYLKNLAEGRIDGEFDLYNFTLPGSTGSFYYDTSQQIRIVPQSNLRIRNIGGSAFNITDERGHQWIFTTADYNESRTEQEPESMVQEFKGNASIYLSRVLTADNRTIGFGYAAYPFRYLTSHRSVAVMSDKPFIDCPATRVSTNYTHYSLYNNLLTEIIFDGGKILFELSADTRADIRKLDTYSFVPCLKKMKVYNDAGKLITEYTFHYSNGSRLQLNELIRTNHNGTPASWQFRYYDSSAYPALFASGKDHWGFFNSHPRGIPSANYTTLAPGWKSNTMTVSKESIFLRSQTGLLHTIIYPTGGSSVFTYEPNSITFTDPQQLEGKEFLQHNFASQLVPVVEASTENADELSGSFTLSALTPVTITATRAYQPRAMINSVITLTRANSPGNLLTASPLRFECLAGTCSLYASIDLAPGTYYYSVKKYMDDSGFWQDGFARLSIQQRVPAATSTYLVGGCRIASIKHFDGTGNNTMKQYLYNDRFDSLGYINIPKYISRTSISMNRFAACVKCGTRSIITEESLAPMSGPPVEYLYVKEMMDEDGQNGAIEYSFTPNADYYGGGSAPYMPPFKLNWKAGLLKSRKIFRNNNGKPELVQLDTTVYTSSPVATGITRSIKAEYSDHCPLNGPQFNYFNYQLPVFFTERFQVSSQSQIYFDSSGQISSTSDNIYNSSRHHLPTETRSISSDGSLLKEMMSYSFDYDTTFITGDEVRAIRLLQRKNILLPVEKLSIKTIDGKEYITGGMLFTYKPDIPVPDKVYELLLDSPLIRSTFINSRVTAGRFVKDNRYFESASFTRYDSLLNILEMQATHQPVRSLLWDHRQQYPVCEVSGAKQQDIACTSFETNNHGNWTLTGGRIDSSFFLTGKQCLQLADGKLSKTGLTTGRPYTISYWSRAGVKTITGATASVKLSTIIHGWTFYEHSIIPTASTISISGSGHIDEVRLYPAGAEMISYTYDPLIGLTSKCDVRGNIEYYEYDDQNRLTIVRDMQRNVLKKIEYSYQERADGQKTGN